MGRGRTSNHTLPVRSLLLALMLVCGCTRDATRLEPPGGVADADTGRVAIEGGSLFWEAAGEGAPVVLIHGGNLDRRMWDAQFAALQRDHRVIRYDARGFGKSSPAARPFKAPDDLAALLRAHGIPRATLIGLSMGGGIAIDFALAYPEMVDRLVLAAPSISGGVWDADSDTLWLTAGRAAFARGDSIGLALAWLESQYIRSALRSPEQADRIRGMITDNAGHLMRRARDQDLEREVSPPAAGRLAELRMPILLLVGDADTPVILSMAHALGERALRVQRIDFPGIGHMINLEAEAPFNAAMLEFLSRPCLPDHDGC
jgi:pimeloyl-ACP methyl ester carboxylesterase